MSNRTVHLKDDVTGESQLPLIESRTYSFVAGNIDHDL
jgi:hypothetical protein